MPSLQVYRAVGEAAFTTTTGSIKTQPSVHAQTSQLRSPYYIINQDDMNFRLNSPISNFVHLRLTR